MKSILEELFYGNLCPNSDCRSKDEQTKELMGYIADHHDNLLNMLTDKQKEVFELTSAKSRRKSNYNQNFTYVTRYSCQSLKMHK